MAVDNPSELSEHEVVQQILCYLETDTVIFISDVINYKVFHNEFLFLIFNLNCLNRLIMSWKNY